MDQTPGFPRGKQGPFFPARRQDQPVQILTDEDKDDSFTRTWSGGIVSIKSSTGALEGPKMARTRGISNPCNQDSDVREWEPEPLHLPLYVPVDGRAPKTTGDGVPEHPSRVIVIDLT
jgi:hypothetical protein